MPDTEAPNIDMQAIREAIAEAGAATIALRAASFEAGSLFRRFDVARANEDLSVLAQSLGSLLALSDAIASALTGLHGAADASLASHPVDAFGAPVERLLTARAASDCIRLADLLEHDLPAVLDHWEQWFASLS
jgi:hypothetical protein